jgi:hypothetical protein
VVSDEALERLRKLIGEWRLTARAADWNEFGSGVEYMADECADELEALVAEWTAANDEGS